MKAEEKWEQSLLTRSLLTPNDDYDKWLTSDFAYLQLINTSHGISSGLTGVQGHRPALRAHLHKPNPTPFY